MTNREFNELLDKCIERGKLKEVGLDKVFVLLTWWNDKFLPLEVLDGNYRTGEKICVFGDTPCNRWSHDGLPCAFWIYAEAVRPEAVVHRPVTLSHIYPYDEEFPDAPRKFLIMNSPKNLLVDIDPSKTKIIKNHIGETMLCFYVADRDEKDLRIPLTQVKPDMIQVIDSTVENGKYRDGYWDSRKATPEDISKYGCKTYSLNDLWSSRKILATQESAGN